MTSIAKFLLIADTTPRALLFDRDRRLLGEVIEDDGFIVEQMLKTASPCLLPRDDLLAAVVPPPPPHFPVRCFALA